MPLTYISRFELFCPMQVQYRPPRHSCLHEEIAHEKISKAILPLPLIQVELLSVGDESIDNLPPGGLPKIRTVLL